MAKQIQLDIVTPERKVLSVVVDEVIAPGDPGLFGVRPGHTPFIASMEPGALTYFTSGRRETFAVGGGFVEVANDRVIVLAETAERADEIDLAGAERDQEEATRRLRDLKQGDIAREEHESELRRANVRVAVARGVR
jgi:F-type H+-transporting ATPase subunit epsilon